MKKTVYLILTGTFLLLSANLIFVNQVYSADIVISPRLWYGNFDKTVKDGGWLENQNYDVDASGPLIGITMNFISDDGGSSLLSLYYGKFDGDHNYTTGGDFSAKRFDVEYLWINKFDSFSGVFGARLIVLNEELRGSINQDNSSYAILGEIGLTKAIKLDEQNRHRIFGSFLLPIGISFWEEDYNLSGNSDSGAEFTLMYDASLGYLFALDRFSFQVRYRIVGAPAISDTDAYFLYGPELALSFAF